MNGDNDETSGGAIIFMTDGEQSCNNGNELDIDDSEVLNRIAKTKVRIITVAFGYVVLLCPLGVFLPNGLKKRMVALKKTFQFKFRPKVRKLGYSQWWQNIFCQGWHWS